MHLNLYFSYKSGGYQDSKLLSSIEINEKASQKIFENDYVYFYLSSDELLENNSGLWLTEDWFPLIYLENQHNNFIYGIDFSSLFPQGESFYKFFQIPVLSGEPKRFAKAFLNYFGSCEISFDSGESNFNPVALGKIEILSSKISENDIENIFDFLLGNQVSYWQAISRAKVKSSSNKHYQGHILWLLYQLKNDLNNFLKVFPQFELEPRTRVIQKSQIVNWSENLSLDESSIVWLLHNCHVLEKTAQYDTDRVRIHNRYFKVNQIQTQDLIDDTNLYENKIIHGYLYDVRQFLSQRLEDIDSSSLKKEDSNFTLRDIQVKKYYQRLKQDCIRLLNTADELLNSCQRAIPVDEPIVEFPNFFQGFEAKDHYYQIGTQIIKWFDKKNLKYDSNFLFSGVRTLDKLYELFCLFKIIGAVEDLGYDDLEFFPSQATKIDWEERTTIHAGKYVFRKDDDVAITIYYEQLPKYLFTSSSVYKRGLLPDYIVEIKRKDGLSTDIIILDAKYKSYSNVKRFDLPELTLKYLHGLSVVNKGFQIKGLFLLHPKDKVTQLNSPNTWFYHKENYNIFSETPILPAIGTIEVGVGKHDITSLSKIIKKVQESV